MNNNIPITETWEYKFLECANELAKDGFFENEPEEKYWDEFNREYKKLENKLTNLAGKKPDYLFELILADPEVCEDWGVTFPLKPTRRQKPYQSILIGCYAFIDSCTYEIIYVGKARNLKERLRVHWCVKSSPLNRWENLNNKQTNPIVAACWLSDKIKYASLELELIEKLNPLTNIKRQ